MNVKIVYKGDRFHVYLQRWGLVYFWCASFETLIEAKTRVKYVGQSHDLNPVGFTL